MATKKDPTEWPKELEPLRHTSVIVQSAHHIWMNRDDTTVQDALVCAVIFLCQRNNDLQARLIKALEESPPPVVIKEVK